MEQDNGSLKLSWSLILDKLKELEDKIKIDGYVKVYGIPRGGQVVAGMLGTKKEKFIVVDKPFIADIIVDDLYDSGTTYKKWKEIYKHQEYYFLFDKREEEYKGKWLEFPWELSGEKEVEENVIRLLEYFGEDVNREGLQDTPKRYIKFFKEF